MNISPTASRRTLGVAGVSAALAVTAAVLAQGTASADVIVNLPAQNETQVLPDGTKITLARTAEKADVAPTLGGTPLHRGAQVSAKYEVTTSKKAKIRIQAGYIVGCQVSIGGFTATGNGSAGLGTNNVVPPSVSGATSAPAQYTSPSFGGGVGGSLSIGPGQATSYYINQVEKADDFGSQQYTNNVDYETTDAKLSYVNEQIQLNGCAGYAQARSFALVRVRTSNVDKQVTFYGKPFSIG